MLQGLNSELQSKANQVLQGGRNVLVSEGSYSEGKAGAAVVLVTNRGVYAATMSVFPQSPFAAEFVVVALGFQWCSNGMFSCDCKGALSCVLSLAETPLLQCNPEK